LDVDGLAAPEQDDQDRKADRGLRRRHRKDEEDEDLPRRIAQEVGKGDEV